MHRRWKVQLRDTDYSTSTFELTLSKYNDFSYSKEQKEEG